MSHYDPDEPLTEQEPAELAAIMAGDRAHPASDASMGADLDKLDEGLEKRG